MVPAAFGVTAAVPFVDLVLAHPSPGCPPVATHVVAFVELQVKFTDRPTVIDVGVTDIVTLGRVTTKVAVAVALTPAALQFKT
jgi:hypothetical protein